jgi:uncharacterized tellurite resistance protein B-like protein
LFLSILANNRLGLTWMSIEQPMIIHTNFPDFVLFLYVYIAYSDGDFHPQEKEIILEKMKKLFPDRDDHEKQLVETIRLYSDLEPDQFKPIFIDTFKQFPKVKYAQKYKIYSDMYDIVHADGKINESEETAMNALKEIIDISY